VADLNFTFKDSAGAIQTARGKDNGTGIIIPVHELSASEEHIGQVGGRVVQAFTEFTRPADTTPYAANDSVFSTTTPTTAIQLSNFFRNALGNGYITGATSR
jgi:hypothetical protein